MNGPNRGHQADKLMELFQEVANHNLEDFDKPETEHEDPQTENEVYVELDILNLPPRREVHRIKKSKYSITFTWPVVRFVFVIIFLIAIVLLFYFNNSEQIISFFSFN